MDPLSEVLSLLKLENYVSGGFAIDPNIGIEFPTHLGIKCYAVGSGSCWLTVEGVLDPVLLSPGDCVLLPRGLPFCLATDLSGPRIKFSSALASLKSGDKVFNDETQGCSVIGGHFLFTGPYSETLLISLPVIVHLRKESDKATLRWSLERIMEELRDPQPGGSLIARHLAYTLLVQALRLHLQEEASRGIGWFYALADPQMRIAITSMHTEPEHPWTIQQLADRAAMSRTVFAQKFKKTVGTTSMDYLTRWRMVLAGHRLRNSTDSVSAISSSIGYETESAFGKAFRRVWGCSPREHRHRSEAESSPMQSSPTRRGVA